MPELMGTLDTSVNGPKGLPPFDGDAWERADWRRHEEHLRPNAIGNFCFEVTLGYRRLERGR